MQHVAWGRLPREVQLRVAYRLARREARHLEDQSPEVCSIGVGLRQKERAGGRLTGTVCVRFSVERKRRRLGPTEAVIPDRLPARLKLGANWVRTEVPTDVECLWSGREQNGNDVYAAPDPSDGSWVAGAVTCLVRDEAESVYLMGCHHVLALSALTAGGVGRKSVDVFWPGGVQIAKRAIDAPFPATGSYGVDASLAVVSREKVQDVRAATLSGSIPRVHRRKTRFAIGTRLRILVPDGSTLTGSVFDHKPDGGYLPYQGQSFWVFFEELYGLRVTSPRPTLEGDSGSPVISDDSTLVGMHFWGDPQRGASYFYPSYLLFRDWTFRRRIDLIPT